MSKCPKIRYDSIKCPPSCDDGRFQPVNVSVGDGVSVFAGEGLMGSTPVQQFHSLCGTGNTTVSLVGDKIVIDSQDNTTFDDADPGVPIMGGTTPTEAFSIRYMQSADVLIFRTLVAGSGITITPGAGGKYLEICSDFEISTANVSGVQLFNPSDLPNLKLHSLVGSGDVLVQLSSGQISIRYEAISVASSTDNSIIFSSNPGLTEFRGIDVNGGLLTKTQTSNDIVINLTSTEVGTGASMVNTSPGSIEFKTISSTGVILQNDDGMTLTHHLDVFSDHSSHEILKSISPGEIRFKGHNTLGVLKNTSDVNDVFTELNVESTGSGESVINSSAVGSGLIELKSMVGINGVTVTTNGDEIIFDASVAGMPLFSNLGTGVGLYESNTPTTDSTPSFKSLTDTGVILLTDSPTEVDISLNVNSVGTGESIVSNAIPGTLDFRSIIAGNGITITSTGDEIEITSGGGIADTTTPSPNATNTECIIVPGTSFPTELKCLNVAGPISLSTVDDHLVVGFDVSSSGTGISPIISNVVNSGLVELKDHEGTGAIQVIDNTDRITYNLDVVNVGIGEQITDYSPGIVNVKTIIAGPGVFVTNGMDGLTISVDAAFDGVADTTVNPPPFPTDRECLIQDVTATPQVLKCVNVTGPMSLSTLNEHIVLQLDFASVGTGESIISSNTTNSGLVELKSHVGMNVLSVTSTTTEVIHDLNITSTATGESLLSSTSPGLVEIKDLIAGSGITLTTTATDVELSLTNPGDVVTDTAMTVSYEAECLNVVGTMNPQILKCIASDSPISLSTIDEHIVMNLQFVDFGSGESIINSSTLNSGIVSLNTISGIGSIQVSPGISIEDIKQNIGTGEEVYVAGASSADFKTFTSSNTLLVSSTADEINYDLSILGSMTGETLLSSVTPGTVELKDLISGNGITLTGTATDISISLTNPGDVVDNTTMTVAYDSECLYITGTANPQLLKCIGSNSPISLSTLNEHIEISLDVLPTGTGESLVSTAVLNSGIVEMKDLIAGNGITLSSTGTDVEISMTNVGDVVVNTSSASPNPTNTECIYVPGTINPQVLKCANATGVLSLSTNSDHLVFGIDVSSVGAGDSIISSNATNSGLVELRSIVAGDNITLTTTVDEISISSVGVSNTTMTVTYDAECLTVAGTMNPQILKCIASDSPISLSTIDEHIVMNLEFSDSGSGESIINSSVLNSGNVVFNTISGIGSIQVSPGISIEDIKQNIGTGEEVYVAGASSADFKTFTSSNTLLVSSTTDEINYDLSITDVGSGESIISSVVPGIVQLNSISAGSGVSVATVGNDIEVSLTNPGDVVDNTTMTVATDSECLYVVGTSNPQVLKCISSVGPTSLSTVNEHVQISLDIVGTGTGESMISSNVLNSGIVEIKDLIVGSGITLTSTTTDIELSLANPGDVVADTTMTVPYEAECLNVAGTMNPQILKCIASNSPISLSTVSENIVMDLEFVDSGSGQSIINTAALNSGIVSLNTISGIGSIQITPGISIEDVKQNIGTGEEVYVAGASSADFKTFTSSNVLNVTSTTDEINYDLDVVNVGSGEVLISTTAPGLISMKSLTASNGIMLTATASEIEISVDSSSLIVNTSDTDPTPSNAECLLVAGTSNPTEIKCMTTNGQLSLSTINNHIVLELDISTSGVMGDTATSATLIDSAVVDSGNVILREIEASTGLSLSNAGGLITLSTDIIGVGSGEELFVTSGNQLQFKSVVAGSGITLTPSGTEIEISLTNPGDVVSNTTMTSPNATNTECIYVTGTSNTQILKCVNVTGPMSLSTVNEHLVFDLDFASVGTGESIISSSVVNSGNVELKSITGSGVLEVTSTATEVDINLDIMHSGTGGTLLSSTTPGTVVVKGLTASTGIVLTPNADDIEISVDSFALISNTTDPDPTPSNAECLLVSGTSNPTELKCITTNAGPIALSTSSNHIVLDLDVLTSGTAGGDGTNTARILESSVAGSGDVIIREMSAGDGMSLVGSAGLINISNNSVNVGGGENLFVNSAGQFQYRSLTAGSGITLTGTGTEIQVSLTNPGDIVSNTTMTSPNATNTECIYVTGTSNTQILKCVNVTGPMSLSTTNEHLVFDLDFASVGSGESIISSDVENSGNVELKSITGSGSILASSTGTEIDLDLELSQIGTGAGKIIASNVPGLVEFKSIMGGSGIDISNTTTNISISVDGNDVITNTATADPFPATQSECLLFGSDPIEVKCITTSGGPIRLGTISDHIVFDLDVLTSGAAGGDGTNTARILESAIQGSGDVIIREIASSTGISLSGGSGLIKIGADIVNVGGGEDLLTTSGNQIQVKSLVAGSGVTLSSSGTEITISATGIMAPLFHNSGTGAFVYKGTTTPTADGTPEFRSIEGVGVIEIDQNTNEIQIELNVTNVGTGAGKIIALADVGELELKSIQAGPNVFVTNTPTDIIITSSGIENTTDPLPAGMETNTADVYVVGTSLPFELRKIGSTGPINVTENGEYINIELQIVSVGSGEAIIDSTGPGLVELKSINGDNGIEVVTNGQQLDVRIDNQIMQLVNTGTTVFDFTGANPNTYNGFVEWQVDATNPENSFDPDGFQVSPTNVEITEAGFYRISMCMQYDRSANVSNGRTDIRTHMTWYFESVGGDQIMLMGHSPGGDDPEILCRTGVYNLPVGEYRVRYTYIDTLFASVTTVAAGLSTLTMERVYV